MVDFDTVRSSLSHSDDGTVADCLDDGLDLEEGGVDQRSCGGVMDTMRSEHSRLQTFQHWPSVWGRELARYGFCSQDDYQTSVRCVFCGLQITDFPSPQDAHLQHWQFARQYCPYLQGQDVGNVPLNGHPSKMTQTAPGTQDVAVERDPLLRACPGSAPQHLGNDQQQGNESGRSRGVCSTESRPPTTSRSFPNAASSSSSSSSSSNPARPSSSWVEMVRTARHPRMASYQARLKSLSEWPLLKPSPRELARAGFYHITVGASQPGSGGRAQGAGDRGDSVKCFWCGERIHRWQETDDAVVEHARLSPRCLYVTQLLGQHVHDDIARATAATTTTTTATATTISFSRRQNDDEDEDRWFHIVTATPPAVVWRDDDDDDEARNAQRNCFPDRPHPSAEVPFSSEKKHGQAVSTHPSGLTPSQLDDLMRSPSVQTVLQMGFPSQLIRDLLSHDSRRLSADALCHLALQKAAEQTSRVPPPHGTSLASETPKDTAKRSGSREGPERPGHSELNCRTSGRDDGAEKNAAGDARSGETERRLMCKVCSEAEVKIMFRPCNHLVCCKRCIALFSTCPVCHQGIEDVLTVYLT